MTATPQCHPSYAHESQTHTFRPSSTDNSSHPNSFSAALKSRQPQAVSWPCPFPIRATFSTFLQSESLPVKAATCSFRPSSTPRTYFLGSFSILRYSCSSFMKLNYCTWPVPREDFRLKLFLAPWILCFCFKTLHIDWLWSCILWMRDFWRRSSGFRARAANRPGHSRPGPDTK